jgi:hypothetical protein
MKKNNLGRKSLELEDLSALKQNARGPNRQDCRIDLRRLFLDLSPHHRRADGVHIGGDR